MTVATLLSVLGIRLAGNEGNEKTEGDGQIIGALLRDHKDHFFFIPCRVLAKDIVPLK